MLLTVTLPFSAAVLVGANFTPKLHVPADAKVLPVQPSLDSMKFALILTPEILMLPLLWFLRLMLLAALTVATTCVGKLTDADVAASPGLMVKPTFSVAS